MIEGLLVGICLLLSYIWGFNQGVSIAKEEKTKLDTPVDLVEKEIKDVKEKVEETITERKKRKEEEKMQKALANLMNYDGTAKSQVEL